MSNVRLIPSTITEIALIQFSLVVLKGPSICRQNAIVPREKYPEMDWRAADKVAAWKLFKQRMKVIFVADQVPEERQYALILVAGGDKAYNRWDTLEETVDNPKKVDQVWDTLRRALNNQLHFGISETLT